MANSQNTDFDSDLIRKYPKSNKKLALSVAKYGLDAGDDPEGNGQSQFISPHGVEFKTTEQFTEGALVKIHIALPNYWNRKQSFVEYGRIDSPESMKILGKVVHSEDIGKRGKKKLVTVQTLIIDNVDEQVLKSFLQDG